MMPARIVRAAMAVLLGATSACGRGPDETVRLGPATTVEPALPTVDPPDERGLPPPAWAALLPQQPVPAKVGDSVWATPPEPGSDIPTTGVYMVDEITDHTASLIDKIGFKLRRVPGALIHPVTRATQVREGDRLLCYSWTTPGVLARASELRRGRIVRVQFDWAGQTREMVMDQCQPLGAVVAPLNVVSFPKAGARSLGLVVASDQQRAWIRTDSGHIEVHSRDSLKVPSFLARAPQVGDVVRAYDWATGIRTGTISKELEPGLRYTVKLAGDVPEPPYFITQLLSPI